MKQMTAATETTETVISGLVVPFNETAARTSFGSPVKFLPGSGGWHPDLSRIKLMREHDTTHPVGTCLALWETPEGIMGEFSIPHTASTAEVRAELASKLREGLSVGADILNAHWDGDTYVVERFRIDEVSIVALPAFSDSRATIAAAHTRKDTTTMHTAPATFPHRLTFSQPVDTETTEPATEPASTEQTEPAGTAPEATTEATEPAEPAPVPAASRVQAGFRQAPPARTAPRGITLSASADRIAAVMHTGGGASEVRAALADVVPADDKGDGFLRPAWLGELWTARRSGRPLIDSITTKPLPSGTKVEGFQWETRPQVGAYAGNKTEIPTNKVATKHIDAPIDRTAGGWDVDRIYLDLGSGQMIEALFAAAIEDYAVKTEAKVTKAMQAAATKVTVTAGTALPATLARLAAEAFKIGASIDFVAVAPDIMEALAGTPKDALPFWAQGASFSLGSQTTNPGGLNVFAAPELTAGEILAGDSRAATWYEKNPPVRVNAIDLPRGGVDLGVFGYHGLLINDPRAILSVTAAASNPDE